MTELSDIAAAAKDLARRYYALTGKPLGVTGEIAELEASRILGLTLAPARQAGWDAVRTLPDGREERLQIKGRWMVNGKKRSAKLGRIDLSKPFHAVILVLLDERLTPVEIYRAEYAAVANALRAPGSTARNTRGQLSLSKFASIGQRVWAATAPVTTIAPAPRYLESPEEGQSVWPVAAIAARLSVPDTLYALCKERDRTRTVDRREHLLERLVREVLCERYGTSAVLHDRAIASILGVGNSHPLSEAIPDVALILNGDVHVCELKSGRVDYNRTHGVVGGDWFRRFLTEKGEGHHKSIWEVEQDLIRLRHYPQISASVKSCLFAMVCAYPDSQSSWTTMFSNPDAFRAKMKTRLMKDLADHVIARTVVHPILTEAITARLIMCDVPLASTPYEATT